MGLLEDEQKKSGVTTGTGGVDNLTFGQQLVGINFNPAGDEKVNRAKQLCADLADLVNENAPANSEQSYLYNLIKGSALREILNAQMVTVKLLTLKY